MISMRPRIDLNADVGESFGPWQRHHDLALFEVVTTAHIACGFHAGTPTVMDEAVAAALARGVRIGAHPSYPDLVGFGRRDMAASAQEVRRDVLYQVGALDAFARARGTRVRSVKLHGALYHRMAHDLECAEAVVEAVSDYDQGLWLVLPAGSPATRYAQELGARVAQEAFCDRRYRADGRLVDRHLADAVLSDPAEVAEQARSIARDGKVVTVDGSEIECRADTLCLHGDTPDVARAARAVRAALEHAGIDVVAFAEEE